MRTIRASVIAAVAVLVTLAPVPGNADNFSGSSGNFGCDGEVNMSDNGTQYYWYDSLTQNVSGAQNYTRNNVYDPISSINTVDDSGEYSTTDAIVRDQDYTDYCGKNWHPNGIIGLAHCNGLNIDRECESHVIRYDTSWTGSASDTQRRSLACHESGHSLGLMHRATDSKCMESGSTSSVELSSHDINHLNNNY
jgi:hypothetical protein